MKIEKGRFVLSEVGSPKLRLQLSKNAYWTSLPDDAYSTDNLGAAVKFKEFASEKVKEIFLNTFQEHYELPLLPQLPGLDPHQRKGIEWILGRKRSYLAHAPGAGKTVQSVLSACLITDVGSALFIIPPSLVLNWQRELMKFTEWLNLWPSIGIVYGSDRQEEVAWRADFILIPDSMLTKDWVYTKLQSLKIKFLAVDEASRFKEPFSERSLALYGGSKDGRNFRGLVKGRHRVVLLDGSPMPNRSMELWAPCYSLHPESIDYMGYDDFGYRYCGAKPNDRGVWEYKYSSNEEELKEKIRRDFMHVVTEAELSHPERRRSMLFMNEDVRTSHQKTWENKWLSKPVCINNEYDSQGDLARFRKELGLRKVPFIARYVRERLEDTDESILLFVWHREVAEQLFQKLLHLRPRLIYGGTPKEKLTLHIEEFQKGIFPLLIMNIQAAGRGHNLQRADRVIFGEFSWSDEMNKQAEKRASRKGSEKEFVRCEYIVCPNSMDEMVLNSVFAKERRVKKVIG